MTRVLVIDDEAPILRALRINLAARQYEVSTAADGTSGLAAMARDRPDVLILDLGLPDMDGTEVIKGVRGWTPAGGRPAPGPASAWAWPWSRGSSSRWAARSARRIPRAAG